MDHQTIQDTMLTKGLVGNPAFNALRFLVQPIPCYNGCPLGLYYPDTTTIVLPPDATEGSLLHELGHRHGHYYYEDLSEKYAEDFRKRYQRGRALLYFGNDINNLPNFGRLFEEGEKGAVEVALLQPLAPNELLDIKNQLYSYGERPTVYYGNSEIPWVRVEFTKGVDWLVIIGSVLVGAVIAGVGTLGYAVYKATEIAPWVVPVTLLGVGSFFLLRAMYRQEAIKERLRISTPRR